jgi:hypothetical protein
VAVADSEQQGLDAELIEDLTVLEVHPQPVLVQGDGLVEILDGHRDVVDPPEHGRGV